MLQFLLETVECQGNLPDRKRVCVKVFEGDLLSVLDRVLETVDLLGIRYFDAEHSARIFAKEEAIEFEDCVSQNEYGDRKLRQLSLTGKKHDDV